VHTVLGGRARIQKLNALAVDRIVAGVLSIVAVASAATLPHDNLVTLLSAGAVTATVAWRRRAPRITTAAAIASITVFAVSSGNPHLTVEPTAVALNFYILGRQSAEHDRPWVEALLVALAVPAIIASPGESHLVDIAVTWTLFVIGPVAAGRAIGLRSALTGELRANAERLEREQQALTRQAAAQERNRIARELHDIVAHSVSVMVIQAQAAQRVADDDRQAAREALRSVQGCGRDALIEMRRMIGVLRHEEGELLGAGSPGMAQLSALVERAAASGLPVELSIEGQPRELPPGLDLIAFRVLQEALTNAIKHAGPASAHVRVAFTNHHLELEVLDTGRGRAGLPPVSGGQGLVGMQERLALYGGELHTGGRRGGGFLVQARIPLDEAVLA
jgi:signal transduction histidine kinase